MPLFYFDIYDGLSGLDHVGENCADSDVARREAGRRADSLLVDEADWFRTGQKWQIGVMDARGRSVFNLDFRSFAGAAISIKTASRAAAHSESGSQQGR